MLGSMYHGGVPTMSELPPSVMVAPRSARIPALRLMVSLGAHWVSQPTGTWSFPSTRPFGAEHSGATVSGPRGRSPAAHPYHHRRTQNLRARTRQSLTPLAAAAAPSSSGAGLSNR